MKGKVKSKAKGRGQEKIASRDTNLRWAWWVFAAIVFVLVIAIRIRLLGVPLERDEGEYAYAGQLILDGVPPYKLAYSMKFPGIHVAYAVMMAVFGQSIIGIHLGLLLVNALTIVLVFFVGRRLINITAGIAAAIAYAVLSISPWVLGFAAHATHFVVLPVLGAILLLFRRSDQRAHVWLFGSGLLFGIALLMKQPALFLVLLGPIYIAWSGLGRVTAGRIILQNILFGLGVIIPFGLTCLLLLSLGVFEKFWFWTVVYARGYASLVPVSFVPQLIARNAGEVIGGSWPLWLLAGFGLVVGSWDKTRRATMRWLVSLLVVSLLALSSGLYFRNHYFILVLPAVSLLVGIAINQLAPGKANGAKPTSLVPLCVLTAATGLSIFLGRTFYFTESPTEICRMLYKANPFPESIKIAEYLRNHTGPSDTIGVLGSEPQIYFYSGRHSATGYIYTYSLMEAQKEALPMQQEMIREIEQAGPKYLVFVNVSTSWVASVKSESLILDWAKEYTRQNYDLVGLVNIAPDGTDYYFDSIPGSVSAAKNSIKLYARKT